MDEFNAYWKKEIGSDTYDECDKDDGWAIWQAAWNARGERDAQIAANSKDGWIPSYNDSDADNDRMMAYDAACDAIADKIREQGGA